MELRDQLAELKASEAALKEKVNSLTATREDLEKQAAMVFRNIGSQLLAESRKSMTEEGKAGIGTLLEPLKLQIKTLNDDLDKYQTRQNENSARFDERLKSLTEANARITQEAERLTNALTTSSKVQGDWGENVLQRVLDLSGLQDGVHYVSQVTRDESGQQLSNDEGSRLRPDFLLKMPGDKVLVIDSKVSLTAFLDYVNTADEKEREQALKRHLASVKNHVNELAAKDYARHIKSAADFVLMFMPSEPAYLAAMQHDKDLWQYAYSRKVVIVSPTHFLSVAQLLMQLWAHDKQSRNVEAIAKEVTALLKKLDGFENDLQKVEKNLESTQNAIQAARTKYEGKGGVKSRADKIRALSGLKKIEQDDKEQA